MTTTIDPQSRSKYKNKNKPQQYSKPTPTIYTEEKDKRYLNFFFKYCVALKVTCVNSHAIRSYKSVMNGRMLNQLIEDVSLEDKTIHAEVNTRLLRRS